MAKFLMCAVRDQAVTAFNTPMFFRSKAEAIRSFHDAVNDKANASFTNHANDYSLWYVGVWDDNGDMEVVTPECLIKAIDCLQSVS